MKLSDIPLGSNILVDVERSGLYYTLKSKVMDSNQDGISILPPYDTRGIVTDFKDRDKVFIRYVVSSKIFRWVCSSWKDILDNGHKYVFVTSTDSAENANKREAVRLDVGKEINLTSVRNGKTVNAYLKDISQVGVGFISKGVYEVGDMFDLVLDDLNLTIPLRVKIVRHVDLQDKHFYGCLVTKSDSNLRRYITDRQLQEIRKMRSKG